MTLPTDSDTIAAPATPPGSGGVAVVRVSGNAAADIAAKVAGEVAPPRQASLRSFCDSDGCRIDQGLLIYFPGPASFTGEDVVEFHCHGGPVVVDLLLQTLLQAGARFAQPGEFSRRAFLNGRMDLTQVEAVADLIEAGSVQAARAAVRSMRGAFSSQVHALAEKLLELRVFVEAALDFPDEEIDFLADESVQRRCDALCAGVDELAATARQGALLRDGISVVLAGPPNAGKSSLLNRLTGQETAIVTHLPGTTRDVLRERISIDGMPLHVVDTAGLRGEADLVEAEGIRRARREIDNADRVLLVVDASAESTDAQRANAMMDLPDGVACTIIRNKIDLTSEPPGIVRDEDGVTVLAISALTGAGLEDLRAHLSSVVGYQPHAGACLSARTRHIDALRQAGLRLQEARSRLAGGHSPEIVAEELRLAHQSLAEITGEISSEDLLGRIFSSFCVGK
ncbi:MAG: tRNA uridine-5-carboxymethylaminomethyl(34) synthesis GTPase MnmE [Chromatiales bacterium]|nr:tRNA uridine-5-carboxymethylaminomethyl(34) synthesis GTPase MnmE [Chromatiales bacterium]